MKRNLILLSMLLFAVVLLSGYQIGSKQKNASRVYHFNESAGTVTTDYSVNRTSAEVIGATWVSGKYGSCLYFDGNDCVIINTSFMDAIGNVDMGFSVWLKQTAKLPASDNIVFWIGTDAGTGNLWQFDIRTDRLRVGHNGADLDYISTANHPKINRWIHYAYTHKNPGGKDKLYRDGELIYEGGTTPNLATGKYWYIGALSQAGGNGWVGYIDELIFWVNYQPSRADIRRLYEEGRSSHVN